MRWASTGRSTSAARAAGATRAWSAPQARAGRQRFSDADQREAVGALVEIIRTMRPHVVVTYDPNGGYGHPDHIQAHVVTTAAVAAAGDRRLPGRAVVGAEVLLDGHRPQRIHRGVGGARPGRSARRVDHAAARRRFRRTRLPRRRDRRRHRRSGRLPAKIAALRAHATQLTVGPPGAPSRCRTTSRCPSWRRSTTFWPPAPPETVTSAAGRPICSPESTSSRSATR